MNLKETLHQLKQKYKGQKIAPLFNAFHTFLYEPNETTHSGSHIRDVADLKRIMSTVLIALMPCLFFGAYNIGYQYYTQNGEVFTLLEAFGFGMLKLAPLIAVSYGVGLAMEFLFAILRGHEVNEGYLVSGMLIPLIVPVDLPLWQLALAVIFAVVIGKEAFGGTGMNVLNPALTARAFLFFAYAKQISGDIWVHNAGKVMTKGVDAISGATILGDLAQERTPHWDLWDMLIGTIPGSIGETSVIAIGIGAFILILSGVGSWKIMFSMLVGGTLAGILFNAIGGNALFDFPFWKHLIVGGFLFGMVFMATDPVTATQTEKGKWIYGFFCGFLAIIIRVFNPAYPEGVMMAILLMNVFAPLIDYYVIQANINKRLKRVAGMVKQKA